MGAEASTNKPKASKSGKTQGKQKKKLLEPPQEASSSTSPAPTPGIAEDVRDKYIFGDILGNGSFGSVRKAILKDRPNKIRAVKIMESKGDDEVDDQWSESAIFRREVELLQGMDHPNIIRFWDAYEDVHFLYIVMDLCKGGEVFNKLLELKTFTEEDAGCLASQMISAIQYLHNRQIVHRDVKAENFLLAEDSTTSVVKMIDFGFACEFKEGQVFSDLCGSLMYMAPELLARRYTHMVDMWAMGILMYLLTHGNYPYRGKTKKEVKEAIKMKLKLNNKGKLSPETVHFIEALLCPEPSMRLTASEALSHTFISQAAPPDILPSNSVISNSPSIMSRASVGSCIMHELHDAKRAMASTKKALGSKAKKTREKKLEEVDHDFGKGIRHAYRVGKTPQDDSMNKPVVVCREDRQVQIRAGALKEIVVDTVSAASGAIMAKVTGMSVFNRQTTPIQEFIRQVSPVEVCKNSQSATATRLCTQLDSKELLELQSKWKQWREESRRLEDICDNSQEFGQEAPDSPHATGCEKTFTNKTSKAVNGSREKEQKKPPKDGKRKEAGKARGMARETSPSPPEETEPRIPLVSSPRQLV